MTSDEKTHVEAILDLANEFRDLALSFGRQGAFDKAVAAMTVVKEAYDCYSKLVYAAGLVFYFNRPPETT